MSYTALVKDLLFNLEHVAGIGEIAQLPDFEDAGLDTALRRPSCRNVPVLQKTCWCR